LCPRRFRKNEENDSGNGGDEDVGDQFRRVGKGEDEA